MFYCQYPGGGLTDCDFRQPKGEERIENIAAACASCGLIELAKHVTTEEGEGYMQAALRMLHALDELCADWSQDRFGILQKCTASYHDDGAGRHVNIVYGDYFFRSNMQAEGHRSDAMGKIGVSLMRGLVGCQL